MGKACKGKAAMSMNGMGMKGMGKNGLGMMGMMGKGGWAGMKGMCKNGMGKGSCMGIRNNFMCGGGMDSCAVGSGGKNKVDMGNDSGAFCGTLAKDDLESNQVGMMGTVGKGAMGMESMRYSPY